MFSDRSCVLPFGCLRTKLKACQNYLYTEHMTSEPESKSYRSVRRILVIRGGGLGDFILILPVLSALRHNWPAAELELLCNPEMGELARISGYAEAVRSIHDSEVATLFAEPLPDLRVDPPMAYYFRGFDLVVSFLRDSNDHLKQNIRSSVPKTLFIRPPLENRVHAALQFLATLELLGIRSENVLPRLRPLPNARDTARDILPSIFSEPSSFPIALHPGSGSARKNWSTRGFSETIRWIKNETEYEAILITGEADAQPSLRLHQELGSDCPLELHQLPLQQLVSVLQSCRLLIGNDSGVSHLAAAAGIPVLALFGPTSPEVWRPLGNRVRILRFEHATPERVYEEIRELL